MNKDTDEELCPEDYTRIIICKNCGATRTPDEKKKCCVPNDDSMRWISEDMLKEAYSLATKNGYALAIKHFEERIQNGEDIMESIRLMKELHTKSLIIN